MFGLFFTASGDGDGRASRCSIRSEQRLAPCCNFLCHDHRTEYRHGPERSFLLRSAGQAQARSRAFSRTRTGTWETLQTVVCSGRRKTLSEYCWLSRAEKRKRPCANPRRVASRPDEFDDDPSVLFVPDGLRSRAMRRRFVRKSAWLSQPLCK